MNSGLTTGCGYPLDTWLGTQRVVQNDSVLLLPNLPALLNDVVSIFHVILGLKKTIILGEKRKGKKERRKLMFAHRATNPLKLHFRKVQIESEESLMTAESS